MVLYELAHDATIARPVLVDLVGTPTARSNVSGSRVQIFVSLLAVLDRLEELVGR